MYVYAWTEKIILMTLITKHAATRCSSSYHSVATKGHRHRHRLSMRAFDLKHKISLSDEFAQHMQPKRDSTSTNKWILLTVPDPQVFIV